MATPKDISLPLGSPERISLQDIADQLGLSKATVCRALNGRGRTSEATRKRVKEAAATLGYEPDPALAALTRYRWGDKVAARTRYSIAHIAVDPLHEQRTPGYVSNFRSGVQQRATALKLIFETHAIKDSRSAASLSRLLHARGVDGVIFEISGPIFDWDFRWDLFACVLIGFDGDGHRLNAVTSDWFSGLRMISSKVAELDRCQRIGFLDFYRGNPSMDARIRGAMLLERDTYARKFGPQPPLHHYPPRNKLNEDVFEVGRKPFLDWFEKHRPDAIIDSSLQGYWWLKEAGVSMPEEVVYVSLTANAGSRPIIAGAIHDRFRQGGLAVDLLFNLIQGNEKGMSDSPLRLTTPCGWFAGKSYPSS